MSSALLRSARLLRPQFQSVRNMSGHSIEEAIGARPPPHCRAMQPSPGRWGKLCPADRVSFTALGVGAGKQLS
eukprot:1280721-Prymnesium_polylepis.1